MEPKDMMAVLAAEPVEETETEEETAEEAIKTEDTQTEAKEAKTGVEQ
jgi:hypothetical protein